MKGECSLCTDTDENLTHLNLYISGSEGIWVCLECRMNLTNYAKALRLVCGKGLLRGIKLKKEK